MQEEHIQESLGILVEVLAGEGVIVGDSLQILTATLVIEGLTPDVDEIVLEVVVATVFICHTCHENGGTSGVLRVIIVVHLRPTLHLEVGERRTAAEDRLVRALLVVAQRTVVDTLGEYRPGFLDGLVMYAVSSETIFFDPFLLGNFLGTPWQFAHQLKHDRIVLGTLHGVTTTIYFTLTCG